jgi:iron-sulfur cluster repair protein YtfE (RIC family)
MNGKTAKRLRKITTGMVVAAEERGKHIAQVSLMTDKKGTVSVAKNTWKGAYKALKKGVHV